MPTSYSQELAKAAGGPSVVFAPGAQLILAHSSRQIILAQLGGASSAPGAPSSSGSSPA